MREELIDYIHGLSDEKYQYQAWVEGIHPCGGYDALDYAVHFLYDDTDLADDHESMNGWVLVGKNESNVIAKVVSSLNVVFDKYGIELSDKEYIVKEEWIGVIKAAKEAEKILLSSE
ncbi:hypothetical protein EKN56_03230 [Limnobaculum zhutongyuii]|uniref:Uncharacterized protein n=2 Tax=Limnobaculum zhutongyuii TaxID=2498113 RepID=A0A411WQW4_9GAMM|nr:hypothetical protein EKN56_03230 [Limnobaculum zhutongyuii]TQS88901.1 hypothetical protein ELQ32_09365 [Limnobaculum zhutongyuii]